jgi:hypothetical protein
VNQGIIAAVLSVLFYLTTLFTGGQAQPMQSMDPPMTQQDYTVLGQMGTVTVDRVTIRHSPATDGKPLGTVTKGATITILDESDNWYKIRPRLGTEGWVPNYAVGIEKVEREVPKQVVLGFYPGGDLAYDSLLENRARLTGIASLGWQLDSYGTLTHSSSFDHEEMGRSLYYAGNQEMDTYATISIHANPTRLLTTPYLREKSMNQIIDTLQEWGLKGALLDVAYIPGEEQSELFEFAAELAERLGQEGLQTALGLPWDTTIDYATASQGVDYIILKQGAESRADEPGPLQALPRVETMLQEITTQVDEDKLILALSTGGINWSRTGSPASLSHQEILELAAREGASVRWDMDSKTPYFRYGAGQEVWFENRYSLKYKFDLVKEYNLGGLALKDLGQEDADIWTHM